MRSLETLVVTDLDGTLWHGREVCHPATLDAMATLLDRGVAVLVATGRRLGSARKGFTANGLSLPAVLLNGALGHDFRTDRQFHRHAFADDEAQHIFDVLDRHDLSPCVYTDDGLVHAHRPTTSVDHVDAIGDDMVPIDAPRAIPTERSILNFSMLGMPRAAVEPAADAIAATGLGAPACYQDGLYGEWSMMIQPPGISKWEGVQAWLDHEGVTVERMIAVGDGGNDIELLEGADVAVAVEGSPVSERPGVDATIPPPDRGGWAGIVDLL